MNSKISRFYFLFCLSLKRYRIGLSAECLEKCTFKSELLSNNYYYRRLYEALFSLLHHSVLHQDYCILSLAPEPVFKKKAPLSQGLIILKLTFSNCYSSDSSSDSSSMAPRSVVSPTVTSTLSNSVPVYPSTLGSTVTV